MDEWLVELNARLMEAAEWMKVVILGVSTFISEDLTTIGAGILVAQDALHPVTAVVGCFLGILIGDGLLYLVGLTFGRPALNFPIVRKILTPEKVTQCQHWFERNGMMVVFVSRFLPGTRLPTYFAAGLMGSRARYFLLAATFATAIWTPLLVGAAWFFGEQLIVLYSNLEANPFFVVPISVITLFVAMRYLGRLADWKWRRRLRSRFKRIVRWEFWPIPIVYAPIILSNIWWALRYRRLSLPLASNPGIKHSGIIGESKAEILDNIGNAEFTARHLLVKRDEKSEQRIQSVLAWFDANGLSYPIVLKPDVGQRGAGVKIIRSHADLKRYLDAVPIEIVAQEYAPGPYEFGVFYIRYPDQEQGRIFSITGKDFPKVVGDGFSTLEELILGLPSAIGRVHIFMARFADRLSDVPESGQTVHLVQSGNHCQGTIFLDSGYLKTPQLEHRIDEIAKGFDGFFIGRFDLRVDDLEAFRTGIAFKIIELNGATSEPSHIYDPQYNIVYGWKMLLQQWKAIWEIGSINYRLGVRPSSLSELLAEIWRFRRLARHHVDAD